MPTAEQIKALLQSHYEGDDTHFSAVAMQVAAHEARQGRTQVAQDLRELIDRGKSRSPIRSASGRPALVPLDKETLDLLTLEQPDETLGAMTLPPELRERLQLVLVEQRQADRLRQYNLSPRRKLLLMGPPGCGKTLTARALAGDLRLPLFSVVFETLITRWLGETGAKLRSIFEGMKRARGVYLFDEFDAIGTQRGAQGDVGEIRRVLSSFLQLLERDQSDSLIICATNHPWLLDNALYRRFDEAIEYTLPTVDLIQELMSNRLELFPTDSVDWSQVIEMARGLSHAEIGAACDEAAKRMILSEADGIQTRDIIAAITNRQRTRPQPGPLRHDEPQTPSSPVPSR